MTRVWSDRDCAHLNLQTMSEVDTTCMMESISLQFALCSFPAHEVRRMLPRCLTLFHGWSWLVCMEKPLLSNARLDHALHLVVVIQ